EDTEIEAIAEVVAGHDLAGVIVSNTTISRPPLKSRHAGEQGGLSGAPLFELSTQVLRLFRQASAGRFLLIGAGGIGSGAQAYAKIRA
ncbi:MAG: quinone-dependent dihydroorotate dehydrogenase, partial [Thiobacillaceae bacterium]